MLNRSRSGSDSYITTRLDSSDGINTDCEPRDLTTEKEESNKRELKEPNPWKEKELGGKVAAGRNYKLKLYLTYFTIVSIIVATWVLFIVPLGATVYAVLISSFKSLSSSDELSENATFLRTFSRYDSCPFNETEALARLHRYSTWLQLTYSNQSERALNSSYGRMIGSTTCVSRFVNNGTQCTPECIAYFPGGDDYAIAWRVIVMSFWFVTFLVSMLGIVTWIKIGVALWDFPNIIYFYLICTVLVQSVCVLSGQIYPQWFYCKHKSLFEARVDTSIPCNIQGVIFHYSLMVFLFWYIFAVINILYIISLGVSGVIKFEGKKRWIHLFESIFCWGFPLLVCIITLAATKRYKFNNHPDFCYPKDIFALVTIYLPALVSCLFNGTAIPIVVGIMLKRHYLLTKLIGQGTIRLDWLVQMAVFTIAFSLSIWMILISFTITRFQVPSYDAYLYQYSRCTTIFGSYRGNCCLPVYREYYSSGFTLIIGFFNGIWGVAGLSALANRDVREFWKNVLTCKKCCHSNQLRVQFS